MKLKEFFRVQMIKRDLKKKPLSSLEIEEMDKSIVILINLAGYYDLPGEFENAIRDVGDDYIKLKNYVRILETQNYSDL